MVKMYSLYKLFELKFTGKTSEEKFAASLGTFYYVYYSILKHVDVTDRLPQCMRYASTI